MRLVLRVDRRLYVLAALYDLVHAPRSPAVSLPYALYLSGLGRLLYAAYLLEREGCWGEAFRRLMTGEPLKGVAGEVARLLDEAHVYQWESLEPMLRDVGDRVLKLYEEVKGRFIELARRIYGLGRFFKEVHVVLGFTPLRGLYGSLLYWDERSALASAFTSDLVGARATLDLVLHEVLHGLLRLNNVELPGGLEEALIDVACPEGYLSVMLGLADTARPPRGGVYDEVARYFEEHAYERGMSLLEYVKARRPPKH